MRLGFRLLDVFSVGPFTGNQLCVVPDAGDVDADTMRSLTREIGFSESTFVTAIDDEGYDVRIFTGKGASVRWASDARDGLPPRIRGPGRNRRHAAVRIGVASRRGRTSRRSRQDAS